MGYGAVAINRLRRAGTHLLFHMFSLCRYLFFAIKFISVYKL